MKGNNTGRNARATKNRESGFALLFVFLLAALIAIALYNELPRVAFESQRQKEQLLIDRGEQYSLAVRRFYMKNGRYPATMDELEHLNNIRFLRRKYLDPMTGKADWRIVHVGPGGYLTDSLVQQPQNNPLANGQNGANGATGATGFAAAGGFTFGQNSSQNNGPGANASSSLTNPLGAQNDAGSQQPAAPSFGTIRRPSDRGPLGGQPGAGDQPGSGDNPPPDNPLPPLPSDAQNNGQNNGNPSAPVQDTNAPNANGQPPQNPGIQPLPGPGMNPQPGQPGMPPAQPGDATNANSVANQIMSGLSQPHQNPLTPSMGVQGNQPGQNQMGSAGGIAGVASKYNGDSIKRYNDQTNYRKWEFVFDLNKFRQQQMGMQPNATPAANTLGGAGNLGGGSTFGGSTFGGSQNTTQPNAGSANQNTSQPSPTPGP